MNSIIKILNEDLASKSELLTSAVFSDVGQDGWTIQTYSALGIDYVLLTATADSVTFPLHKDTNAWFGYVVEGEGELHLGLETETTETLNYGVGDIILFDPDTFHGWKNHSQLTKLLFVKPTVK